MCRTQYHLLIREIPCRFEHQQAAGEDAARPLLGGSSPSAAPLSPQQPPPSKLWDRRAALAAASTRGGDPASSPFLVGPPASHSVHWTSQPSPVKPTPPAASARNASRLQRTFHRPEAGLGRSPYVADESSRMRQQTPASVAASRASTYQYEEPAPTSSDNLRVRSFFRYSCVGLLTNEL